ncbi:hypothetical protein M422DRAFT_31904 [Sphaerobolus stellatus SS14]|uniref:N-acetyltransferase domain-containing protein n=1 Tax=Sphaerobolus stellatus (strain SS14) TaxID=990650 RepID=A0A0C9V2W2_SPHS4|nr:hypothetical protein M422DRAFT_31904 [Sphaerobolus stellatus SS14]
MSEATIHEIRSREVDGEVVGTICWFGPGQHLDLQSDPEYQAFFRKLSDEGKKWRLETFVPIIIELSTAGFGLEPGNLDRYVIERLGVKVEHRKRGIGGRLIKQAIDAAKADPKVGKVGVISSENGISAYKSQGMKVTSEKEVPNPWTNGGVIKSISLILDRE